MVFNYLFNFIILGCTFKPQINKNSEMIDKKNKEILLRNMNDESLDYIFKNNNLKFKIN